MLSFRVSDAEKDAVERLAAKEERKLADMVRRLFRLGLKSLERRKS